MHTITKSAATVVAADTQSSVAALDQAFLTQARLCATIVEASSDSKLPIAATQKLLDSITAGLRGLVASREEVVTAVREINKVQARSNMREESFGCPNGLPELSASEKPAEIVRAA